MSITYWHLLRWLFRIDDSSSTNFEIKRSGKLKSKQKNLVIIPIYNEEAFIEPVMGKVREYYSGDILVVNDGSTDKTADILPTIDNIAIITHKKNEGYGRSLINGFNYAINNGYQFMATIDCDEQHEPHHLPEIFDNIAKTDIYSASRYLQEDTSNDQPPSNRYKINMTITEKINCITGFKLTDGFCGMKGYRVSAIKKMNLKECCYAFPIEFWIQAYHFNMRIEEFPIERIYKNLNRTFGSHLDDPVKRLANYEKVLKREVKRWQISLPLEYTQTT